MGHLLKIKSESSFVKDTYSKAIINNDKNGYDNYIARRNEIEANKAKLCEYENQLNSITQEMGEIKNMLISIINKK
jgi:hypothetical protein